MDNKVLSIRITDSMLKELREIAKKEHFMDLSDTVRSIVRTSLLENRESIVPSQEYLSSGKNNQKRNLDMNTHHAVHQKGHINHPWSNSHKSLKEGA
jgi:metal-responsive CopG/Arc/MetJ family transcriptional regulator